MSLALAKYPEYSVLGKNKTVGGQRLMGKNANFFLLFF
jgi:hypothetical protein